MRAFSRYLELVHFDRDPAALRPIFHNVAFSVRIGFLDFGRKLWYLHHLWEKIVISNYAQRVSGSLIV